MDSVVPADRLVDRAVALARGLSGKNLVRQRPVPPRDQAEVEAALAALPKRTRPNVRQAAETVVRGSSLDAQTALAEERALLHRLRLSEESRNLRYPFFAKQQAAKALKTGGNARSVAAGVVGAGTMSASSGI